MASTIFLNSFFFLLNQIWVFWGQNIPNNPLWLKSADQRLCWKKEPKHIFILFKYTVYNISYVSFNTNFCTLRFLKSDGRKF